MLDTDALQPVELTPIGRIRTPFEPDGFCPSQPVEREQGEARIELLEQYLPALADLDRFSHIFVLFYLDRGRGQKPTARPPWAKGREVGLFASRSDRRPVPIGLSSVRLKRIEGPVLVTNLIDAFDGTPVLDIKPYIPALDAKQDANHGWIEDLDGWWHMLEHVRGLPHHHDHGHGHDHDHGHGHDHEHPHHRGPSPDDEN